MIASCLLTNEAGWERFRDDLAARPRSREILAGEANAWLTREAPCIVHKKHLAQSGDPHDYISLGPYWWPDPAKPDGLPWKVRDGEVNPLFYEYDSQHLEIFADAVAKLILWAYAGDSPTHAWVAGKFLKAWFLDPATRMNPHLTYAQFIPGICEGRGIGIIDTTALVFLLNAVPRLEFNEEWTPKNLEDLKAWVSHYLDWLLTSPNGKAECAEHNNHGTWYDAQIACFAVFCDRPQIALRQIEQSTKNRIALQLQPDGSQPHELARTLSFTYCTFNLLGFTCLARIAQKLGSGLWNWESPGGGNLPTALRWMLPYFSQERDWTHPQIRTIDYSAAVFLLSLAESVSGDPSLSSMAKSLEEHPWQRVTVSKSRLTARKSLDSLSPNAI